MNFFVEKKILERLTCGLCLWRGGTVGREWPPLCRRQPWPRRSSRTRPIRTSGLPRSCTPWPDDNNVIGVAIEEIIVANPGCLSRIPDPDFYPSRIRISDPELGSKNSDKREGWKKICCHTFFCRHKFHKIEHYFMFEMRKKRNLDQFSKTYITFYLKICH